MKQILLMVVLVLLYNCKSEPEQKEEFITANQDTYISSGNLTDYSKNEKIIISNINWGDNIFFNRGLLNFSFEELPNNIKIDSAFLYIYSLYDDSKISSGDNSLKIQRVTEEWNESTVKWGEQPESDEGNEVILPKTSTEFQDYEKIDVSKMIQSMFLNDKKYGFLLKMENENNEYKTQYFASSNHKENKLRPTLKIFYRKTH